MGIGISQKTILVSGVEAGGLAGFPGLVTAARPLGGALVTTAGPGGHEVAGEGDLEGQVGGEIVETVRGKSIRTLMRPGIPSRARVKEIRAGSTRRRLRRG